jgi:hypothetical protein
MVSGVVIAIVSLRALLTLVWFFEVVAGCLALLKGRTPSVAMPGARSHRTAVLIPAHNEGPEYFPPSGTFKPNSDPTTVSSWSRIIARTTPPRLSGQQGSK